MNRHLALLFCLALSSCMDLGLARETPKRLRYVLDTQRPVAVDGTAAVKRAGPEETIILEVRSFHGAAAYIDNDFIYRRGTRIEADYYNGFLTPPAVAISELARRWLGDADMFSVVQGVGTRLPPTHALEADIFAFYGDFTDAALPKAVLEIAFALVRTNDPKMIARRSYREEIVIKSAAPEELIGGWNQALASILTSLETDLLMDLRK